MGEPGAQKPARRRSAVSDRTTKSRNITFQRGVVSADDRARRLGQRPATIWFTGLSASGKSTLAFALEGALFERGRLGYVLDGDNIRHGLNRDLGFSAEDRTENIRRIAEVARLLNDAGLIAISAFISPYREDRAGARAIIGGGRFVEVFVDAPLAVCEERDPRGLYRKARAGEIEQFTGLTAPYEPPLEPQVHVHTEGETPAESLQAVLRYLEEAGLLC